MKTTVTKRWQTVVPAKIRQRYKLKQGTRLAWLDNGKTITVIPIPEDPLKALRGRGKGEKLVAKLLEERRKDRELE